MSLNAASDGGVSAAGTSGYDLTTLTGFPGPVMLIDRNGAIRPVNELGVEFASALSKPAGRPLFAIILELADTAREKGTAMQEQVSLPAAREEESQWFEATVLPLADANALMIVRNVTLDINMRDALIESRQRFKDLVEIAAAFAWETSPEGTFSYISPAGGLGYRSEELHGRDPKTLLLDEADDPATLPFVASLPVQKEELWVWNAEGNPACILVSAVPLLDTMGRQIGTRGVCQNITDERLSDDVDARKRMHERVVTYIVESVRKAQHSSAMLETASTTLSRAMEAAACEIFQFGDEEQPVKTAAFGKTGAAPHHSIKFIYEMGEQPLYQSSIGDRPVIGMTTTARGLQNGAVLLWREEGSEDWSDENRILLEALRDQLGIVLSQVAEQRRLEELSRTDGLTGLVNRRAFNEELVARMKNSVQRKKPGALMYLDLDNFKPVNDSLGHERGDAVLKALADILRVRTRETDLIARIGGDEFAVWFDDADGDVAEMRGEQVISAMRELALEMSASKDKPLNVSVGIAVFDFKSGETPDALIVRADTAMYTAKNAGKSQVAIAAPADDDEGERP
jgi:diguanylate cyclase (GGDEF)-like protein/PAS domain S-box-containing protein